MGPIGIGLIGCGVISSNYLRHAKQFPILDFVACADLIEERAKSVAEEHGVPRACQVDELLADDSIELIVNLTVPQAHAEVALAAIQAGKHVYSEKPLGVTRDKGQPHHRSRPSQGCSRGQRARHILGGRSSDSTEAGR